jgi:UDP-N-acetylmuramoylalanine--D-glutamate ligase
MPLKSDPRDFLGGRRLLVWGLGAEGRSTLAFLERFRIQAAALGVMDRAIGSLDPAAYPGAVRHDESRLRATLASYDCILKSPGIPTARLDLDAAVRSKITCQTDLFLRWYPGTVVGVTGTKGKSTTSKLIHLLLSARDPAARLAGNIGVPVLDLLDPSASAASPVVCEMSSYQLEYTQTSPPVAVLLNLYQDHLDFHGGFAPYAEAKWNIARHQTADGHLVLPDPFPLPSGPPPASRIHRFPPAGPLEAYHASFSDGFLKWEARGQSRTCPLPIPLQTRHAREHLGAALTVAHLLDVPAESIPSALAGFTPLPHRLQPLGAYGGIAFYDDSIATIPEAAIAAVESVPGLHTLITGGKDRGVDYGPYARFLAASPVRELILMPETGAALERLIGALPHPGLALHRAETLEQAVELAFRLTPPGRACLLSPAASSYNTHRNFEDKSRDFLACIQARGSAA